MKLLIESEGSIELPIEFMTVKDCLFIPTLKPEITKRTLRKVGRELEMKFEFRVCIDDGYYGVKFWRVA